MCALLLDISSSSKFTSIIGYVDFIIIYLWVTDVQYRILLTAGLADGLWYINKYPLTRVNSTNHLEIYFESDLSFKMNYKTVLNKSYECLVVLIETLQNLKIFSVFSLFLLRDRILILVLLFSRVITYINNEFIHFKNNKVKNQSLLKIVENIRFYVFIMHKYSMVVVKSFPVLVQ